MNARHWKRVAEALLWLLLLTMPYWLDAVGGYTQLGSRVLIMALAAMSLNFLLGYTGVLSFGHAAYFGLGAYGMGLTIKYLLPSTFAGMAVGVLAGAAAAAIIGLLIVHLRGIYFAMVTIAFAQFFISSPTDGITSPGETTVCRGGIACQSICASSASTSCKIKKPSTTWYFSASSSPS